MIAVGVVGFHSRPLSGKMRARPTERDGSGRPVEAAADGAGVDVRAVANSAAMASTTLRSTAWTTTEPAWATLTVTCIDVVPSVPATERRTATLPAGGRSSLTARTAPRFFRSATPARKSAIVWKRRTSPAKNGGNAAATAAASPARGPKSMTPVDEADAASAAGGNDLDGGRIPEGPPAGTTSGFTNTRDDARGTSATSPGSARRETDGKAPLLVGARGSDSSCSSTGAGVPVRGRGDGDGGEVPGDDGGGSMNDPCGVP